MKKNVSSAGRVGRVVIGLIIIALGLIYESWWGLIGIFPLVVAATSVCPFYLPFGISECKTHTEEKK
jgi:predicted RND superfamily exporter protein